MNTFPCLFERFNCPLNNKPSAEFLYLANVLLVVVISCVPPIFKSMISLSFSFCPNFNDSFNRTFSFSNLVISCALYSLNSFFVFAIFSLSFCNLAFSLLIIDDMLLYISSILFSKLLLFRSSSSPFLKNS